MAQESVRKPQAAGGQQRGRVFGEGIVSQAELRHARRQAPGVRRLPRVGPPSLQPHLAEVLQEEADGGRRQVEVQAMQDDALQVAELLAGEGVAAEGEELFHARRVHLDLRVGTGVRALPPGSSAGELARSPACPRPPQAGLSGPPAPVAGQPGPGAAPTCLQAMSSAVTPRSWKQSAATGVVARKRSRMLTARQRASKESPKCRCTGMSQLTSLQRASAVTYGTGSGDQAGPTPGSPAHSPPPAPLAPPAAAGRAAPAAGSGSPAPCGSGTSSPRSRGKPAAPARSPPPPPPSPGAAAVPGAAGSPQGSRRAPGAPECRRTARSPPSPWGGRPCQVRSGRGTGYMRGAVAAEGVTARLLGTPPRPSRRLGT